MALANAKAISVSRHGYEQNNVVGFDTLQEKIRTILYEYH